MAKKVLFVFNPHAGKGAIRGKLVDLFDRFAKAGFRTEVYVSQFSGDLRQKVKKLARGKDYVICSGGDGTLNETISALMEMETKPILGYLPAGTTNDFGASHGIPRDFAKAADVILEGQYRPIDIGSFNEDRYFAYVAGFGAFMDVSYRTSQELKAILGHPAYIVEGALSLKDLRPIPTRVRVGDEIKEMNVLVSLTSNASQVAGVRGLGGEDVGLDDGIFETMIIESPENAIQLTEILTAFIQGAESRFIHRIKSSEIEFQFEEPVEWVLDGEYGGEQTKVCIRNHQKSILFFKNC